MSPLPDTSEPSNYGDGAAYWDAVYSKRLEPFEWYHGYDRWGDVLGHVLGDRVESRILHVGCGTSALAEDLYDRGFCNIVNTDVSAVVIEQMKRRNRISRPGLQWLVGDATAMAFASGTFDLVIDKGLMDALRCSPQARHLIALYTREVSRVLAACGSFVCISFGSACVLKSHLEGPHLEFEIRTHKICAQPSAKGVRPHYVHVCSKPYSSSQGDEAAEPIGVRSFAMGVGTACSGMMIGEAVSFVCNLHALERGWALLDLHVASPMAGVVDTVLYLGADEPTLAARLDHAVGWRCRVAVHRLPQHARTATVTLLRRAPAGSQQRLQHGHLAAVPSATVAIEPIPDDAERQCLAAGLGERGFVASLRFESEAALLPTSQLRDLHVAFYAQELHRMPESEGKVHFLSFWELLSSFALSPRRGEVFADLGASCPGCAASVAAAAFPQLRRCVAVAPAPGCEGAAAAAESLLGRAQVSAPIEWRTGGLAAMPWAEIDIAWLPPCGLRGCGPGQLLAHALAMRPGARLATFDPSFAEGCDGLELAEFAEGPSFPLETSAGLLPTYVLRRVDSEAAQ